MNSENIDIQSMYIFTYLSFPRKTLCSGFKHQTSSLNSIKHLKINPKFCHRIVFMKKFNSILLNIYVYGTEKRRVLNRMSFSN